MRVSRLSNKYVVDSKKKTRRILTKKSYWIIIALVIVSIVCIIGVFYINYRLKSASFSKDQIQIIPNDTNQTFRCSKEQRCDNCSYFISCVNLIDEGQNYHSMHVKIRNQKNKQIDCLVRLSVNDENKMLVEKTYKIGIIQQKESKDIILPYNYSIEKTEFQITPLCE